MSKSDGVPQSYPGVSKSNVSIYSTSTSDIQDGHRFGPHHRWRVLGIGVSANASFAAALSGIPTTAVFMRADYHIGTSDLGYILGAMGLGIAISELPWGLVTDRLGDRKILLTGLGLTGVALAFMAMFVSPRAASVPPVWLLASALVFVGAIGGSLNGSSGRAVMRWFQEGQRGFAMSVRQMALPAGGALGALILPTIAERSGFQAVYAVLAAFCFITAAFAWAWLHEPPLHTATPTAAPTASQPTRSPLRNRQVWRMVCGLGALCIPQVAVVTFAAVFLHDFAHFSTAVISTSIVAFQLGAAFTRVWSGHFTDRNNNRRSFLRVCALATVGIFSVLALTVALVPVSSAQSALLMTVSAALLILGGTVASTWHGIAYTELATIAGMKHVATALGLGNTFAFSVYFLTPLTIPPILTLFSWPGVWLGAAGAALLAFLLFPKSAAAA